MAERIPTMYGRYYTINLVWRGREFTLSAFTPKLQKLQRTGAQRIAEKIYPGCRVVSYHESDKTTAPTFLATEGTMKTFRQFREHCGIAYDVVGHQCGHCDATGYHPTGEKCQECDGTGTMLGPNNGMDDMEEDLDLKKMEKELDNASKMHKGQADRIRKHLKKMKSEENDAYAIGMAQAMKSTGDKPPLKKSTIKKAHKIADAVKNEDWQKKSGKNPEGGLNEKGRKSYERQNPGSDLKRPSKKVGNPRRKSFCARMKGMKKKLTSKKTARDPDSRINKSLRAWNC